jgi:hypothetical protein
VHPDVFLLHTFPSPFNESTTRCNQVQPGVSMVKTSSHGNMIVVFPRIHLNAPDHTWTQREARMSLASGEYSSSRPPNTI